MDASACPWGGLMFNDYAIAYGMSLVMQTAIDVQNMLNKSIMKAEEDISYFMWFSNFGIPAKGESRQHRTPTANFGLGHL